MRVKNPIATIGVTAIGVAGNRFLPFWSGSYVHSDNSPLYSGIQRKKYRDVGWAIVSVLVCLFPLITMIHLMTGEPGAVVVKSKAHAFFLIFIFPMAALCVRHLISELQDSQLIHAGRDEGITDDVFEHDDDDEEEDEEPEDTDEEDDDLEFSEEDDDQESSDVIDFSGTEKQGVWA